MPLKRMRDYGFLSIPLVFLILLVFFLATPVHAQQNWNVQTVDTRAAGRGSNGYCPIVVDSNNVPSIAYTRSNSSD